MHEKNFDLNKNLESYEEIDVEKFKRDVAEGLAEDIAAAKGHAKEDRERYGVTGNRTAQHLANLVLDYGFEKVCHFEKLTPAQLRKKMNGSFSDQLKENFRQQRLAKIKK